jgi:hypothetical protein
MDESRRNGLEGSVWFDSFWQTGEMRDAPLELSRRSLFPEGFRTEEHLALGRAVRHPAFLSTAPGVNRNTIWNGLDGWVWASEPSPVFSSVSF